MKPGTLFKTAALAAAITAPGAASANIFFDTNGAAPGGVVSLSIFDWFPGNALFDDAIPFPSAAAGQTPVDFDLRVQGALNLGALAAGTEVTYQAVIPMSAIIDASSGSNVFVIDAIRTGGTFDIYFGAANSNDIAGTGYGDGTNILHGDVLASLAGETGTVTLNSNNQGALDQFGADNQSPITTLGVSGNLPTVRIEIDTFDLAFFPADINGDTIDVVGDYDLEFSSDNLAAFRNSNPSDLVVGVAPDYGNGINDNLCGGGGAICDLHVESDGRSPFLANLVPEPAGLALFGLGLLGIGLSRIRRKS
jgi:hypothetical protein